MTPEQAITAARAVTDTLVSMSEEGETSVAADISMVVLAVLAIAYVADKYINK